MSPAPDPRPGSTERPRVVEVAFWLLALAGLALIASGLMLVLSQAAVPSFFRGFGVLFALAGTALAYLAGRTRRGDARFRGATVGLALALVGLLALFSLISRGWVWLLIMAVVKVAAVLLTRPSAHDWFGTHR